MGRTFFTFIFVGITLTFCGAEFTAENVYDFLSRRLDNVNVDIKKMRSDMKKLSGNMRVTENDTNAADETRIKQMFEDFKAEIDTKFNDLEDKFTEKVDMILKEAMTSISNQTNDQIKNSENQARQQKSDIKKHFYRIQEGLSAEKHVFRNTINMFQVRVEGVEQKMFAFENASWKGDKGDVGPPGPIGPRGVRGSKGETGESIKGQKGQRGLVGFTGYKGEKGQEGSPEKRNLVYFSVSLSSDKTLSQNTILKLDNVFTNKGDGYDKTTGIFTAPYSGVYLFLFFVEVGKDKNDIAYIQLYVDGVYRAYTLQDSHHDGFDSMAGNAYISHMSAGEKAWLQTGGLLNTDDHNIADYGTTFTGILLY